MQNTKTVADFVYFAEPADSSNPEIQAFEKTVPKTMQAWTDFDKNRVKSLLDEIFKSCPALVVAAAGDHKLALVRVLTLLPNKPPGYSRGGELAAITGPGYIVVSNQFLAGELAHSVRLRMLAHELVHAADVSDRVAYSKLWIDFATPMMGKLRLRSQFCSRDGQRFYNEILKDKNIWPGLYASANLHEALAEYITRVRSEEVEILRAKPELNHDLVQDLLAPSPPQQKFGKLVKEGRISYECGRNDIARKMFLDAEQIDSHSPSLDYYIAQSERPAYDMMLLQTAKGEQEADALQLSCSEPRILGLCWLRAATLVRLRRYQEASLEFDKTLRVHPFLEEVLKVQSLLHLQLGQLGLSLEEAYRAKGFRGLSFDALTDIESDPEFAKRAIAEISKSPSLRYRLNARAQYYLQLAAQTKDQEGARKLYVLALDDYVESLEIDDKYKLDTVIYCFDISLKLDDQEAAKKYYKQALKLDKEAIPTLIAEVKLLDTTGQVKLARERFLVVNKRIEDSAKCDEPPSATFSFQYLEPAMIEKIDAEFLQLKVNER
jgi:hypothetical protein